MNVSTVLQTTRSRFNRYTQDLPSQYGEALVVGGAIGFGLEFLGSRNLRSAKLACAASFLATTIHALITPFFKYMVGRRPLTLYEEIFKTTITFTLTASALYTLSIPLTLHSLCIQYIFQIGLDFISPHFFHTNPSHAKSIALIL
jgi:hypothetical protein